MPSTVKNGALTFTLSTGGMPALTRVLSQDLRAYYDSDFAEFNEFLQQLRRELKTIATTPEKRTAFWRQTLNQSVIGLLHAGRLDQAKEIITDAANRFRLESQNSPR